MRGEYGTKEFRPGTVCHDCRNPSVGVLVIDGDVREEGMTRSYPLCSRHVEELESNMGGSIDDVDFRRYTG